MDDLVQLNSGVKLPAGAIDCDLHHPNPGVEDLLPFLDDLWKDLITSRGIAQFDTIAYPPNAPLSRRPDWRGAPDTPERLVAEALDGLGASIGILNNLCGVAMIYDLYMAKAVTAALNDWTRVEWLDKSPRLRASICVPLQDADAAVREIDRCATDTRFVQVLFPSAMHVPYGHRSLWPIYATAVRHDLPIGIHAGSAYHHPVTSLGWPQTVSEDYAAQSQIMQSQLASLVSEGVFQEFPALKVVLIESGVSWLPAFLWRFQKFWKGLRFETPWVETSPIDIVKRHVRFTTQPFDAPADPQVLTRLLDHLGDTTLLYASDYPHWHFDGAASVPPGFDAAMVERIAVSNPNGTYRRLEQHP